MEFLIGVGLASVICIFALVVGFDRDRAFYPSMVLVVASYYILFAVVGASKSALGWEMLGAFVFFAIAVFGFKRSPWLSVVGLIGHGVFDSLHHLMIRNPGLPVWWPGFCMSFDILAGAFLAIRLIRSSRAISGNAGR